MRPGAKLLATVSFVLAVVGGWPIALVLLGVLKAMERLERPTPRRPAQGPRS